MAPGAFLMSVIIIVGNATTLVAIRRIPALQTKSNAFVASLAGADLMVGLVLIPYGLWNVPNIRDRLNHIMYFCILMTSAGSSAVVISILSLLLVALDRLVFISRPFFYQRVVTNRVIAAGVALPWTLGLTFGNSQWLIYAPRTHPPQCVATKVLPTYYYKYLASLLYFLPCLAVFCIYVRIAVIARTQRLAILKLTVVRALGSPARAGGQKLSDKSWRSVKMMMTVFGIFSSCWTPRFLLYALSDETFDERVPELAYNLCMMLGLLNSGVNFLVYPAHNREFRRGFRHLLGCKRSSVGPDIKSVH
ncbi:beta-3 adrenergic receptor-like [Physella acuta]|uniref:beta-3 adrenergic receptor-like n=1 Tax=Physella acuta TaxID=109671 RepID=UPI0027DC4490|nr:beta-3 adrenergic receptor-like [Physella acuta]